MSTKTIGEVLVEKYDHFLNEAKLIVGDKILFPTLEEIDIEDLFMLLQLCFPDKDTVTNLLAVLKIRDIKLKPQQVDKMVILVDEVLQFIETVKQ